MKKQNRVAFFNILGTVLLRGISIITAPLFTRLLPDSDYGIVSIYSIWVSAAAIVFSMQTQGTLVNARVEYAPEEQKRYQSSAMGMSMLFFAFFAGLVLTFRGSVSRLLHLEERLIVLLLIQAFGTFCVNFLSTKFVYESKAARHMLVSLGVALMTLGLSVLFILQMPHQAYYGRILAISGTYALIGVPACLYILGSGRCLYRKDYWKFCLVLAVPAVFHNLSDLVLGQIDRVMLQRMIDEGAVGQYSAALNFGGIMFLLFGALNNTWCPTFFDDKKRSDAEQLRQRAVNFLELFTVLSVGFILLVNEVYHVLIGSQYWPGTKLIPIFVASYFLNFLCTFPVNYEYYYKKTKVVALVTIGSSLLNAGLNYVLIQFMGMPGAAVATAVSHGVQLTLHYGYCRYAMKEETYPFGLRMWGKYAAAYFCMMGFVYLAWDFGFLRWAVGAGIGIWELLRIKKRGVLI